MKILNLPSLLMFLLLATTAAVNASEIGIAAIVEGTRISEKQLQQAIDNYLQQQGTNVGAIRDPKRFKEVRAKVLDVLIGQELLWQAASRDKTVADDAEVNQAISQYQAQFDSDSAFDIKLQQGGYNQTTFYQDLRRRISAQKWIDKFVKNNLEVSADEVHVFYLENGQEFTQTEEIRARHILIKLESGASDEARENARALLSGIRNNIVGGGDFAALAKQLSQGPSAAKGGDLGYFTRGQMVAPFEQAAFALAPGEVSEIVETRFGLHLIKLVDRKPPVQYAEKDVSEKIHAYLMQQKYRRAVDEAVSRLKTEATIEKSNM
jgi:peptidyl-prolyl cis-trans isomerase C